MSSLYFHRCFHLTEPFDLSYCKVGRLGVIPILQIYWGAEKLLIANDRARMMIIQASFGAFLFHYYHL